MSTSHSHTVDNMRVRLQEEFKPSVLEITDDSARHAGHTGAASGGGHFKLRMVSALFNGQGRLQRQRLVYDRLADLMKRDIHALSMILLAPDEAHRDSGRSPSAN